MKERTKYSRLAGYLEKLYDKLNADFFNGELDRPVITIQSTPRAYGHYSLIPYWNVDGTAKRELNIAAGTLNNRPIENVIATLLHEMCHQYNNEIANVQDCSRGGTYHNKHFRQVAETHGLTVTRSEKYGWSTTSPSDKLLDWILTNDIQEIKLNRNEYYGIRITGGNAAANGGTDAPPAVRPNHNHRYICPVCKNIARSGKALNLICGDCLVAMMEG